MATNATEGLRPHDERSIEELDDRNVRALTEALVVLPDEGRADGADGLFLVVSHTGNQYLVDTVMGSCECPDMEYRDPDGGCKHVRRAEYATGQRAIPSWVDQDGVDDCLGTATDDGPRYAATDGGEIIDADDDDGEIINADDDGEVIGDGTDDTDPYRPDDCQCGSWNADSGLPCWPCWRDGFRLPPADADD